MTKFPITPHQKQYLIKLLSDSDYMEVFKDIPVVKTVLTAGWYGPEHQIYFNTVIVPEYEDWKKDINQPGARMWRAVSGRVNKGYVYAPFIPLNVISPMNITVGTHPIASKYYIRKARYGTKPI